MSILSKLGIVKSKLQSPTVSIETCLYFMADNWRDIVPESDYNYVDHAYEYGGGRYETFLLKNVYLIETYQGHVDLDEYFKYIGKSWIEVKIYLVDDTFNVEKYTRYMDCYPKIIEYDKNTDYIHDGPWIDDLKSYIKSIKVGSKYLTHKSQIDEAERGRDLKYEQSKRCCNAKRDNILNNYGK
jgi:hypothetical protein